MVIPTVIKSQELHTIYPSHLCKWQIATYIFLYQIAQNIIESTLLRSQGSELYISKQVLAIIGNQQKEITVTTRYLKLRFLILIREIAISGIYIINIYLQKL